MKLATRNALSTLLLNVLADPITTAAELQEIEERFRRYAAALTEWKPNPDDTPLNAALRKAVLLFNHHLFFEVHEVLEDVWRTAGGEEREFLQGLIQIAVAFYHLGNNNIRGALSLLHDGLEKVTPHQPAFLGIEVAEFTAAIKVCHDTLVSLGAQPGGHFRLDLIPQLRFV